MKALISKAARKAGIDTSQTGIVCTNWGVSVSDFSNRAPSPTDGLPATKTYPDGTIDLEFGPLLLVDYMVMDSNAFDSIVNVRRLGLERLRETLIALQGEGFIRFADYNSIFAASKQDIIEASAARASQVADWIQALRDSVLAWERARVTFEHLSPNVSGNLIVQVPHGIAAHLQQTCGGVSQAGYDSVRDLIFKSKKRYSASERDVLAACIRPYLHHALSYIVIRGELELPLMDWADLRPLYVPLSRGLEVTSTRSQRAQDKVRELFSALVPDFEPKNRKQLIQMLKDSRIRVLRDFIRTAAAERRTFQASDLQPVLRELARLPVSQGRIGTGLNLVSLGVGIGATVAGLDPISSIALAAGIAGGQEAVQRSADHFIEKDHSWLYLLMEYTRNLPAR